ncbi:MAG: TIGR02147 family protein, partial [Bdellovibrionota bacterium]
ERLIDLGLLRFERGRYRATSEESTTEMDIPSAAIRNFHSEILTKAGQALFRDSVQEREFLGATFAFSTEDLAEAKESIREFQQQFSERFNASRKKKDSVYQISIQMFRLDQKKEGSS